MIDEIIRQLRQSITVKNLIIENNELLMEIIAVAERIIECCKSNNKVMIAGNGGSAADAQHFAGEFVNRFNFDRKGLPCIALTTDTSVITAIGNDSSYDNIFRKQVEALGQPGDVFIGISTSGNSANIVEAMKLCKEMGVITIGLTGEKTSKIDELCNHIIKAPSTDTPRVQEAHMTIEHIICDIVEKSIFAD